VADTNRAKVKTIDLFDPETEEVVSFQDAFGDTAPFAEKEVIGFTKNSEGHLAFLTKT